MGVLYKDGDMYISNRVEIKNTIVTYTDGTTQELELVGAITQDDFENPYDIESVIIGTNVTRIGEATFMACSDMTSIDIPNSVTSIGNYAFYSTGLRSVTIPGSVESIGNYAFASNDTTLQEVVMEYGVKTIGESCFEFASSLSSITLPNSLISIGQYAFQYSVAAFKSIRIPNSVTSIGSMCFWLCASLETIYYSGPDRGATWGAENAQVLPNTQ